MPVKAVEQAAAAASPVPGAEPQPIEVTGNQMRRILAILSANGQRSTELERAYKMAQNRNLSEGDKLADDQKWNSYWQAAFQIGTGVAATALGLSVKGLDPASIVSVVTKMGDGGVSWLGAKGAVIGHKKGVNDNKTQEGTAGSRRLQEHAQHVMQFASRAIEFFSKMRGAH